MPMTDPRPPDPPSSRDRGERIQWAGRFIGPLLAFVAYLLLSLSAIEPAARATRRSAS